MEKKENKVEDFESLFKKGLEKYKQEKGDDHSSSGDSTETFDNSEEEFDSNNENEDNEVSQEFRK